MITRIVKMEFREEAIADFLKMFEHKKQFIIARPGCIDLEMLQQKDNPTVIFTYSHWESEDDLNAYRGTELFGEVWKETKSYFSERAEAWTLNSIHKLISES